MTRHNQIAAMSPLLLILALAGWGGYALSAKTQPQPAAVTGYLQYPNPNSIYASNVVRVYKSQDDMLEAERISLAGGLYNARGKFTTWRLEPLIACVASINSKILINGSGTIGGTVYGEYHAPYDLQWNVSDVTIIDGPQAGCKGVVESKYIKRES